MDFEDEDADIVTTSGRKSVRKLPNFDIYPLSEAIKDEAKIVASSLKLYSHKGVKEKQIIYACCYVAGIRIGQPYLPAILKKIIGLESRQFAGAISYVHQAKSKGICPNITIITPLMIVNSYIKEKDVKISYENCKKIWDQIEDDEWIKSTKENIIACYILLQLKSVQKPDVFSYFGVTENQIKHLK